MQASHKSTDACTACGKQLKDCDCICQKHICCNGAVFFEGHLADCQGGVTIVTA